MKKNDQSPETCECYQMYQYMHSRSPSRRDVRREKKGRDIIFQEILANLPLTDEKHQSEHTGNSANSKWDKFRHLHLDKLVKSLKDKQNLESST